MRRSFRTRGCFSGWIPRVGTLGWYAMPLQGMDRENSGQSGNGNTIGAPYRKHYRGSVSETLSGRRIGNTIGAPYRKRYLCSVSETPPALRADGLIR